MFEFFAIPGWQQYQPGYLTQDILTLPIEAALVYFVSPGKGVYGIRKDPLFPFHNENPNEAKNRSRHPAGQLRTQLGLSTAILTLVSYDKFPIGPHARGMLHSHLLTELLTSWSKGSFQRKRPFHGSETRPRINARMSFFSGHSSHAFAFSGYTSAVIREYVPYKWLGYTLSAVLYGAAGYVASARAIDKQHNWLDVSVGAVVGTLVSNWVFSGVETSVEKHQLFDKKKAKVSFTPSYNAFNRNFAVNLGVEF